MKFLTKTNIMKICTRLSIAFTVWYLMFGDSFTILSKNRSIILVILFVLDAIILRYLLNDRMKENKSNDYSLVIAPVVADLCTTPVALSAPPNSYQNNSQS